MTNFNRFLTAYSLFRADVLAPKCVVDQIRWVHHHKEWENGDKALYLGLKRSSTNKANRNTHMNEKKYRRLRGQKVVLINLEDDVERRARSKMLPDELRTVMLKEGINPYKHISPRNWQEEQLTHQSFHSVLDPYIAPETSSSWSLNGLGDKKEELKDRVQHKFYNYWHGTRRLKKKVGFEKFNPKEFGPMAENIYISAHQALMERNRLLLHKYLTENAFGLLWPEVETRTVEWELVEFNEPSRVISVRCFDSPAKSGNDIAQLTVRMHSTQKLAIYDRFGRLLLGSETEPRECVEYVVFENHVASVDGQWRLHEKVYPEWLKPKQPTVHGRSLLTDAYDNLPSSPRPLPLGMKKRVKMEEEKRDKEEKLGVARPTN